MDDGQITLTGESPELYERGRLVAHTSDDSGIADVGLSVGLGDGWMLFVGDEPGPGLGWCVMLYGQTQSLHVATVQDADFAREMLERIAGAICKQATGEK